MSRRSINNYNINNTIQFYFIIFKLKKYVQYDLLINKEEL